MVMIQQFCLSLLHMINWSCSGINELVRALDHSISSSLSMNRRRQLLPVHAFGWLQSSHANMPFPSQPPQWQEPAKAQEHKPLLLPLIDEDRTRTQPFVSVKLYSPASHRKAPGAMPKNQTDWTTTTASPNKFEELAARGFLVLDQEQSHGARVLAIAIAPTVTV